MSSGFVFGQDTAITCIQDLPTRPGGEHLCLGYQLDSYGLIFPGYVRDAGYAIKIGDRHYEHLTDASIAAYQEAHLLPDPLPPYSVPTTKYVWGFALWPIAILIVLAARARRKRALRRHTATQPPLEPGASAIEVTTTYSIFELHLVLVGPAIAIDRESHARSWGTWTFPVEPGHHVLQVSYNWLWERGIARIELDVEPGEIKRVAYHVRPLLGGSLNVAAAMPTARVEQIPGG